MKLESVLRKKETSAAVAATVPQPNLSREREDLRVFRDGELAEAQRAAHVVAQALEAAREAVQERERDLADARQRAQAAAAANDREGFHTAKRDVEFDEQQLVITQQRVSVAENRQRALAQQFVDLDEKQRELVKAIFIEEIAHIEIEGVSIATQLRSRRAMLTAFRNHFIENKIAGKCVEVLNAAQKHLQTVVQVFETDDERDLARAELRELLEKL